MKNRCKSLFILIYAVAILFYRADSVVAMAAEENIEPELIEESIAEPEPEQEPDGELAAEPGLEPKSMEESVDASESEQTISTGSALIEWLEAHKSTGGKVKLSDHVVLDGEYSFCPSGINMPSVFVDTDKYTITVNGEIELLSDNHLIFSGQPDGKSIFYVAEKGMLSMHGIAVESGEYALWQEEGGGLVVSECRISGSIHYADMPFVIYQDSICVVVEKSQTLNEALPAQISCAVNRQGKVSYNEWVSLSWNLEGTEKQQEERQRFVLQGSFLHMASAEPVQCLVVYNNYPLTFTDVKASLSAGQYTFQGGYTKPKEALPITVISEYSFDGENWLIYEERKVTDIYTGFFIAFRSEQFDRAAYSNIYIRLQWNDNGSEYFSNVLCYAADDLESAEDIGGSRGGGTSIINLPDDPQQNSGDEPAKEEKPIPKETRKAENLNTEPSNVGTEQPLYDEMSSTRAGQPIYTEISDSNEEQPSDVTSQDVIEEQPSDAITQDVNKEQSSDATSQDVNEKQASYVEPEAGGQENMNHSAASSQMNAQTLNADIRRSDYIVIVIGLVLFSVIAGIAGFCVHSRLGTNK